VEVVRLRTVAHGYLEQRRCLGAFEALSLGLDDDEGCGCGF